MKPISLARMGAEFAKLSQMPVGATVRKPMKAKAGKRSNNLGKWLHPRKGGK